MQTAADAGALAGADELFRGQPESVATPSVDAATAQNGFTNDVNGAVVTVTYPTATPPCPANFTCVEVSITKPSPTYFAHIFGLASVSVTASAVAAYGAKSNYCIYVLDPSKQDALEIQDTTLTANNCGVIVDSSNAQALLAQNSTVTAGATGGVAVTGGDLLQSSTVTPAPTTGAPPAPNPLAALAAPAFSTTCQHNNTVVQSKTTTLNPGVYCGGVTIQNSTVTLNPGTYVGSVTIQDSTVTFNSGTYVLDNAASTQALVTQGSTISGAGVMFYLTGQSQLTLQNSTFNLSAPTSGTYNGILFFQNISDTQQATIQDCTLDGVLYFPGAEVLFQGSTDSGGLVADTVLIQNSAVVVNPWSATAQNPLTKVTLVQ